MKVGTATKNQVVEKIGLPDKVQRKKSFEYWLYSGKESKRRFFISSSSQPVSMDTYGVYYSNLEITKELEFSPILVCIFDENNKLINVIEPNEKEK